MAKARHTNKDSRNLSLPEFIEEGAYVDENGVTQIGTPPWAEPVPEPIYDGDTIVGYTEPPPEGFPGGLDYGQGKTAQQEAEDSMLMLGGVIAAVLTIAVVAVGIFLLFYFVP